MGSVSAEEIYCVLIASDIPVACREESNDDKVRTKMMMCGGIV